MSLHTLLTASHLSGPRSARRSAAVGIVALLLAAVVAIRGAGNDASGELRTATAAIGSVDQVLQSVATIEPVTQATIAFPVAGTVETVDVAPGDEVEVGTVLAGLETASLERALRDEQAGLDTAELNLERALNGEATVGVGGATDGSGMTPIAYTTPALDTVTQAGPSDADIAAAQQALIAAQQQADAALGAVQPAVDNATSVCAAVATADSATFAAALAACSSAISTVTAAQHAAQSSQAAVSPAAAALDDLLAQRAAALGEQPPPTTTPTTPTTPTEPTQPGGSLGGAAPDSGGLPSTGEAGGGGTSVSAERLIALQKAVDVAVLEVLVAQQAVAQASIVSPIAGTVVAVDMTTGDEVDAASSTANIVISGRGGYEATVSVSVDDLADLEVGQPATVRPDATGDELDGEVVAIGVAANAGSFPVTIGLTGDTNDLGNGSTASVGVITSAADDVLAVPTSAVTMNGDIATVEVPGGEGTETVTVEIGAMGARLTEITSGLDDGQEVVLADLDEPLPGSATDTSGTDTTTGGPRGVFGGTPIGPPSG